MSDWKRVRARAALVLLGAGAIGVIASSSLGSGGSSGRVTLQADVRPAADTARPSSQCSAVGGGGDEHFDGHSRTGGPAVCLTRAGAPPNIDTTVWVGGQKAAGYTENACSWPNAGKGIFSQALSLPDGTTLVWGVAPAGASSVQTTLASGESFSAAVVGVRADYPEALFAAVASSAPAAPFTATGPTGDQVRRPVTSC
jgi:hypothetical protein